MNTNELRIGNLVLDSLGVVEISISTDLNYFNEKSNLGKIEFSDIYKPIPLTEEWLMNFGSVDGFYLPNNIYTFVDFTLWDYKEGYIIAKDVKYVHQLQNLYFALTGEELTVK